METVNGDIDTSDVDLKPKEKEAPGVEKVDLQVEEVIIEVELENINVNLSSDDAKVECILDANETVLNEIEKECVKVDDSEETKVKIHNLHETFIKDIIEYDKLKKEYREWILRSKLLNFETKKCSEKICYEINKFSEITKVLLEGKLDEKIENFLDGRIKGIKLIEKMMNNVVKNNLRDFEQLSEEIAPLNNFEELKDVELDVIQKTENQNYNIITSLRAKKDSLVRNYFKFVTSDILNIVDGVQSGTQFLKQKKEIVQVLKPVADIYTSLERTFTEYFCSIDIQKIKVCFEDKFDINIHEAFDLEETDKVELNEKIFEVIRDGFIYSEPLFEMDSNYVVRSAQVIVYKKIS
jgi:molecular chaperone GrpE (heat shock protein)